MVGPGGELCTIDHRLEVLPVAAGKEREGLRDALRRLLQPLTVRILTKLDQEIPDELGDFLLIRFSHLATLSEHLHVKVEEREERKEASLVEVEEAELKRSAISSVPKRELDAVLEGVGTVIAKSVLATRFNSLGLADADVDLSTGDGLNLGSEAEHATTDILLGAIVKPCAPDALGIGGNRTRENGANKHEFLHCYSFFFGFWFMDKSNWLILYHNQLNMNSTTSPSCISYSLPSGLSAPASRAPFSPPYLT